MAALPEEDGVGATGKKGNADDVPLRICIDARLVDGTVGGVQSVVIGLAHGLSRLENSDAEFYFLVYRDHAGWLAPHIDGQSRLLYAENPPGRRVRGRISRWAPLARRAWHAWSPLLGRRAIHLPHSDGTIERAGIDLMHFVIQQRAFLTEVPSIYHPHDLQHVHLPEFFSRRDRLMRKVLYSAFCDQAAMVAVTSTWVKQDVIENLGVAEKKVAVVPLAPVLTAYATPSSDDLDRVRRRFAIDEPFVFYPAQTWPHKNHVALLRALAILRDRGLRVPLVCSGTMTGFFPTIAKTVSSLELEDSVRFLGFVETLELQALYRLARAVVVPSKFEAASGPVWDAFLAGTAAACSNVTSLPRQAGDAALIFDPDDPEQIAGAIETLWKDESLRNVLAERGKRKVADFTWERTARYFLAHYRRLTGRQLTEADRELLNAPTLL